MTTSDSAVAKAKATYNAAVDAYDDPGNSFWERFERLRSVEANVVYAVATK